MPAKLSGGVFKKAEGGPRLKRIWAKGDAVYIGPAAETYKAGERESSK